MNPERKATLVAWIAHIESTMASGDPLPFEIGVSWTPEGRWQVYQKLGDKALMMSARDARKLADLYESNLSDPEWKHIAAGWVEECG